MTSAGERTRPNARVTVSLSVIGRAYVADGPSSLPENASAGVGRAGTRGGRPLEADEDAVGVAEVGRVVLPVPGLGRVVEPAEGGAAEQHPLVRRRAAHVHDVLHRPGRGLLELLATRRQVE